MKGQPELLSEIKRAVHYGELDRSCQIIKLQVNFWVSVPHTDSVSVQPRLKIKPQAYMKWMHWRLK